MFIRFSFVACLTLLLFACAAAQSEIDIDHKTTTISTDDSGDDRGFDPCKLNSNLPVCHSKVE